MRQNRTVQIVPCLVSRNLVPRAFLFLRGESIYACVDRKKMRNKLRQAQLEIKKRKPPQRIDARRCNNVHKRWYLHVYCFHKLLRSFFPTSKVFSIVILARVKFKFLSCIAGVPVRGEQNAAAGEGEEREPSPPPPPPPPPQLFARLERERLYPCNAGCVRDVYIQVVRPETQEQFFRFASMMASTVLRSYGV